MSCFSVYGEVDVVLDASLEHAALTFERELVPTRGGGAAPTIRVEPDPTIGHRPARRFGVTGAATGERFLYPDGRGHFCELDLARLEVTADLDTTVRICCPAFSANVLLEWVVLPLAYFPLAARGWTPLHASGVARSTAGGATLFAAWSGVGKTNLVLTHLRGAAAGTYFGDDIVLVHADGTAMPSSRTVSAYGYNRRLVGTLPRLVGLRMRCADLLRRSALRSARVLGPLQPLLLHVGTVLANHRVEIPRARAPGDFQARQVAAHVRCVAATRTGIEPTLTALDAPPPATAAATHLGALDYELIQFRRLIETWRWAAGAPADPWANVRARWAENLEAFFARQRRYFELELPTLSDPESTFAQAWAELDRACSA